MSQTRELLPCGLANTRIVDRRNEAHTDAQRKEISVFPIGFLENTGSSQFTRERNLRVEGPNQILAFQFWLLFTSPSDTYHFRSKVDAEVVVLEEIAGELARILSVHRKEKPSGAGHCLRL